MHLQHDMFYIQRHSLGYVMSIERAASSVQVVDDMQERLRKEIAEREAEAALYSARLYEQERMASDWWVCWAAALLLHIACMLFVRGRAADHKHARFEMPPRAGLAAQH